jgi:catechol 2,3-dioxygenase-like lactoylglutathione lyase family enzyme
MPLRLLDHVNLCTADVERMLAFYEDVLGMKRGPRPPFSFGGAWLYLGERPVVHLVAVAKRPEPFGDLRIAHFAFSADGLADFVERLAGAGVKYRVSVQTGFGTRQINLEDPDGNRLHVDFPAGEPLPGAL